MINLQIEGIDDLEAALKAVGKKAARAAALVAVQAACEPIVEIAREKAAEKTGALKASIGWRTKPYRKGDLVVGVIGPRKQFRGPDGSQPSRYAHLIEFGHLKRGKSGERVAARPFMRPAADAGANRSFGLMADTFGVALKIKCEELTEVRKARKAAKAAAKGAK